MIFQRKPNSVEWTGKNMNGEGPYLKVKGLLKETKIALTSLKDFYL